MLRVFTQPGSGRDNPGPRPLSSGVEDKAVIPGIASIEDRYCPMSGPGDGMLKLAVVSQKQTSIDVIEGTIGTKCILSVGGSSMDCRLRQVASNEKFLALFAICVK